MKPALLTVASNVLLSLPAHAEAGKIFGERLLDWSGRRCTPLRRWQCRRNACGPRARPARVQSAVSLVPACCVLMLREPLPLLQTST